MRSCRQNASFGVPPSGGPSGTGESSFAPTNGRNEPRNRQRRQPRQERKRSSTDYADLRRFDLSEAVLRTRNRKAFPDSVSRRDAGTLGSRDHRRLLSSVLRRLIWPSSMVLPPPATASRLQPIACCLSCPLSFAGGGWRFRLYSQSSIVHNRSDGQPQYRHPEE